MYSIKTLVAAATTAVTIAAGLSTADAAPWNRHEPVRHETVRHEVIRHEAVRHDRTIVARERVFDTLRFHHYRGVGAPLFMHGHYVVKSYDRFGHVVFVEVNPYTGAFLGEFRI